ncbi:unnamed protein product [Mycena citricolor]|uniref:Hemerythrin-like domain-containing protein n=1 Tax=Mycena citricolor TaxID=2018698 RepID=A0AAD2K6E3_9AGAR|nr:unnamed protein product [Mycena citricolor]
MVSSIILLLLPATLVVADNLTPQSIASQFSLTTRQAALETSARGVPIMIQSHSTVLPFPTATLSSTDAESLLVSQWSLDKDRLQNGAEDLSFVDDPFPNNPAPGVSSSSGPVLQVTYPAGSFSGATGGAQFYNIWQTTNSSGFQSMLLTYEVAFDAGFDWVKGGKLPGLRGGTNATGCSGGQQSDGLSCFSSRLMWRPNVYAYIPEPNNLCSEKSITCNSDFGISISRGSFTFTSGAWNQVTLLVQLNNPINVANGNIELYLNGVKALAQQDLQIRAANSVTAGGMYFSTFFGGSDSSWSTPTTTHTYFRNFQLFGGYNPSTLTGATVKSSASRRDQSAMSYRAATEERRWNSISQKMEGFHNYFKQEFNTIYELADGSFTQRGLSLSLFLQMATRLNHRKCPDPIPEVTALTRAPDLTMHHTIEEAHIFPILATKMPQFSTETEHAHIDSHKGIHDGLEALGELVQKYKAEPSSYSPSELRACLDGFRDVMFNHLDEEVNDLRGDNMKKYWTLEELDLIPM